MIKFPDARFEFKIVSKVRPKSVGTTNELNAKFNFFQEVRQSALLGI